MCWRGDMYDLKMAEVVRRVRKAWPRLDQTELEDAVADVCVDMLHRRVYWDAVFVRSGAKGIVDLWVYAVRQRLAKRRNRPSPVFMAEIESVAGSVCRTYDIVDARLTLERLHEVLPDVAEGVVRMRKEELTRAVTLRVTDDLTNAEAGQRVGVPREYVSRTVSDLRDRLAA